MKTIRLPHVNQEGNRRITLIGGSDQKPVFNSLKNWTDLTSLKLLKPARCRLVYTMVRKVSLKTMKSSLDLFIVKIYEACVW